MWRAEKGRGVLTPDGIRQMLERRGRDIGVRVHAHMFRHGFADAWLRAGGSPNELQELAGWRSPQMVNLYVAANRQVQPREDAMAVARDFPCLWFDGNAEEAAGFYVTLLPNGHVDNVWRSPAQTPSGPVGMVLTVEFTVAGQQLQGLNGGPEFRFSESVSLVN